MVLVWLLLAGCSDDGPPPGHGDDGFAVGTVPLSVGPAPGGLCDGGGSDKECGPLGCAQGPIAPQPGSPSGASNQSLPSGAAAPSDPSGSFSGATPGSAMPAPVTTPTPAPVQDDSAPGSDTGAAGTGEEPTVEPIDELACGDSLPDGGVYECNDAGVAMASAALITDDVPGCGMTNPGSATKLFMSADDSGSMAGPVIARRMIRTGRTVPAHVVRPWEFLNYYDFSFEPAAPGEVRMVPQLSSCPENDRLSLQVALQAEARTPSDRAPLTITFVLDTSGSMSSNANGGPAPIALSREAVLAMASQLRAGDVVSMVTWNVGQNDILSGHEVSGPNDPVLVQAAMGLGANGGTDLNAGLTRGYALAQLHYGPERINRVVLISDGMANVGETDEALIARHADDEEGEAGIYLAGIGVGDGFNDTLMNTVTDVGRGTYVYLDSIEEARHMLGERFLQVVDLAVRNVRLEVTLPYHLVLEKFFGEVASTDAAKVRPQHLGPDDAMLFFQVLRACDPSVLRGDDRILLRATWETPFEREARETVLDTTLNALAGDDADMGKAAAVAAYADALMEAASIFDREQRAARLLEALATVRAAPGAQSDPDLLEIADLLEQYAAL